MGTIAALSKQSAPLGPTSSAELVRRLDLDQRFAAAGYGGPRIAKKVRHFDWNDGWMGMPSMVQRQDGSLLTVMRHGTNSGAAYDGKVAMTTSTDMGRTWSPATDLFAGGPGVDIRTPNISKSRDRQKLFLTYFKQTASSAGQGVFYRSSTDQGVTWSGEQRMDTGFSFGSSAGPVVELRSGRLVVPFHGKQVATETQTSIYFAYSDNGGTTWSTAKVIDGVAAGVLVQEPFLVRKEGADDLLLTYRYGAANNIGANSTQNVDGLTGFGGAVALCAGTGRPSTAWLATGDAVLFYTDTTAQLKMLMRAIDSPEFASTASSASVARIGRGGSTWRYASAVDIGGGVCLVAFAEEAAAGAVCDMYWTTYARGGGMTPFGPIPDDASAAVSGYDQLAVAYDGHGTRGFYSSQTPEGMAVMTGSITTTEFSGMQVLTGSVGGAADQGYWFTGYNDVDIEADFFSDSSYGFGLLFRMADTGTYLRCTVEVSFTAIRMHKFVAGTPTQLTTTNFPTSVNAWTTVGVSCRGPNLYARCNGQTIASYTMTAAEQTTFNGLTSHGFILQPTAGNQYVKRYVIKGIGTGYIAGA